MENPASQAAGSLARRTTVQPAVALGQITSREKDLADLGELAGIDLLNLTKDLKPKEPKRPEPAPRAAVKPIAESAAVAPATAPKPAAKPAKVPSPEKWKIAAAEPRTSWKVRAGVAVALLALAGGGYLGYDTFFAAESTADSEAEDIEVAGDSIDDTADKPASDALDPFDDLDSPARPARASATPRRLARQPQDDAQVDQIEFAPRMRPRPTPAAKEFEPELEIPADEPEAPRLTKADDAPSELPMLLPPGDDSPEAPAKPRIRPAVRHQPDDAIAGFELTNEIHPDDPEVKTKVADSTAQAEQLDGFETDELENHRAVSTTTVTRSVSGTDRRPPSRSAPVSVPDDDYISAEPTFEARRAPPQTPARFPDGAGSNSLAPARRNLSSPGLATPANPTYTVVPSDNFWNISKKQYGTGKYYAALAKHNQGRVADPQRLRPGTQLATPPASELESLYPGLVEKSVASTSSTAPSRAGGPVAGDGRPWFGPPGAAPVEARPARTADASTPGGYFYGPAGEPLYRIGPDDTLGSIAQKHLGRFSRWSEIYAQNESVLKNPNNLTVGTVIRLPADASRVSLSPDAERRR